MSRLSDLQFDIVAWADSISPTRTPANTVVKLVQETGELLDAIINGGDVETEVGDITILLLDICHMHGINLVHAAENKMVINRNKRKWVSDNGVIRRVKE